MVDSTNKSIMPWHRPLIELPKWDCRCWKKCVWLEDGQVAFGWELLLSLIKHAESCHVHTASNRQLHGSAGHGSRLPSPPHLAATLHAPAELPPDTAST